MAKELQKILLVEDEEDIRTIAKFTLEKRGKFTVEYCANGNEALEKVKSFHPDLILLDVMMPGMDGVETFKALRKLPEIQHIPILFMTAKAQAQEIASYKQLSGMDVISKPFDAATLSDQLREIWNSTQNENINE